MTDLPDNYHQYNKTKMYMFKQVMNSTSGHEQLLLKYPKQVSHDHIQLRWKMVPNCKEIITLSSLEIMRTFMKDLEGKSLRHRD